MAIFTRLSRLFRADVHAVLDMIEEPDVLLRQSIREMELAVAQEGRDLKRLTERRTRLANRTEDLREALARTDEELDLCFENGKEDLARTFVRRKLELNAAATAAQQELARLERRIAESEARHRSNRARLDGMRQKAETLLDEAVPDGDETGSRGAISDEDVEVALLRERQRRAQS